MSGSCTSAKRKLQDSGCCEFDVDADRSDTNVTDANSLRLYTIGHSSRSLQEFIEIAHSHQITHIVDVRTVPKSRHVPWFNKAELSVSLAVEEIGYSHLSKLGGLRKTNKNSINGGWRNASFRGYADYMQTAEFAEGLAELNILIQTKAKVAIMCTEAVPWRCHRSMIADAEIARHIAVWEIMSRTLARPRKLTNFAVVNRENKQIQIYYPPIEENAKKIKLDSI